MLTNVLIIVIGGVFVLSVSDAIVSALVRPKKTLKQYSEEARELKE
jgi:hypothetical protein